MFSVAKLHNLEGSPSDHSPILLVPREDVQQTGPRCFKFEIAWLLESMCRQLKMAGRAMYILVFNKR